MRKSRAPARTAGAAMRQRVHGAQDTLTVEFFHMIVHEQRLRDGPVVIKCFVTPSYAGLDRRLVVDT